MSLTHISGAIPDRLETERAGLWAKFWGVRGSIAVPGPDTVRYGGNTPCVEIACAGHTLIFDAGTGIRPLGLELVRRGGIGRLDVFLTHTHFDHINGMPFFLPAFAPEVDITIWAGHLAPERGVENVLQQMMAEPLFPIPVEALKAKKRFIDFRAGETLEPYPGIALRTAPLNHPNRATGYRIDYGGKSIAYVTDTEHRGDAIDETIRDLVLGVDYLIYDAMFSAEEYAGGTEGWGHSTWDAGLRLADAAGVGQFVLFHHAPHRTDAALDAIGAELAIRRPGTLVATEGMVLRP